MHSPREVSFCHNNDCCPGIRIDEGEGEVLIGEIQDFDKPEKEGGFIKISLPEFEAIKSLVISGEI